MAFGCICEFSGGVSRRAMPSIRRKMLSIHGVGYNHHLHVFFSWGTPQADQCRSQIKLVRGALMFKSCGTLDRSKKTMRQLRFSHYCFIEPHNSDNEGLKDSHTMRSLDQRVFRHRIESLWKVHKTTKDLRKAMTCLLNNGKMWRCDQWFDPNNKILFVLWPWVAFIQAHLIATYERL